MEAGDKSFIGPFRDDAAAFVSFVLCHFSRTDPSGYGRKKAQKAQNEMGRRFEPRIYTDIRFVLTAGE